MMLAAACLAVALLVLPCTDARRRLGPVRRRSLGSVRVPAPAWIPVAAGAAALALGAAVGAAVAVVLGTVALRRGRGAVRADRRRAGDTLAAALETVVAELRVGAHPATACRTAAREHPGPVGTVFAAAAARAELGGTMSEAVRSGGHGPAWDRVGAVWRVAEVHGLGLAALLDAVRSDLRDRGRSARRIEASMAGPRATAMVLAALPAVGVLLGQAMGAAPLAVLTGGGAGGIMLVVGVALACAGLLWTDVIVAKVAP
ncbi:tight adherence protein B [Rhodococcus corynebacterioides]|uniref:Tight adherence protein B n=2 Tax=Mycobacteriales TaxID=85007 RepID=A0ABS2KYI2_9NOCA|nr:tight adherence protein B [Rhodococcus corynebacterioides]